MYTKPHASQIKMCSLRTSGLVHIRRSFGSYRSHNSVLVHIGQWWFTSDENIFCMVHIRQKYFLHGSHQTTIKIMVHIRQNYLSMVHIRPKKNSWKIMVHIRRKYFCTVHIRHKKQFMVHIRRKYFPHGPHWAQQKFMMHIRQKYWFLVHIRH